MSNFSINQKVVKYRSCPWIEDGPDVAGDPEPKIGEIVIINYINTYPEGVYIGFVEMPQDLCYHVDEYKPLEEYLAGQTEEVLQNIIIKESTYEDNI